MQVVDDKFTDIIHVHDYEIWTDSGWEEVSAVCKTIEYQEYVLTLEGGYSLRCADDHIVFCQNDEEKLVKDLTQDDLVQTEDGLMRVISVEVTESYSQMYDVQVDSDRHSYYTDGILSHNTTTAGIYALWVALFNKKKMNIYILSNKGESAKDFLNRIKEVYCDLEPYLKRGITEWNKTSITFENGTAIHTSTTTPDSIRGRSVSVLILDEFAHVRPEVTDPFWKSAQPTVASGSAQIIIISTPNGNTGQFYEIWKGAETGKNGFKAFRIEWNEPPGRDEEFKRKMIAETSAMTWAQEYFCFGYDTYITLMEGDAIFKEKIGYLYEKLNGSKNTRYEIETPHGYVYFDGIKRMPAKQMLHRVMLDNGKYCDVTYNHEFVVGGNDVKYSSLKLGDKLDTTEGLLGIQSLICLEREEYVYDVLEVKNTDHSFYANDIISHNCSFLGSSSTLINGDVLAKIQEMVCEPIKTYPNLEIWDTPKPNRIYLLGCDVAMGVGRDYSVIQILDITDPNRFRQIGVYADDYVRTPDFTAKINELGRIYNYAFVIVENNTYGAQICRDLWNDYEYEWLYFEKGKKEKGINANVKTKVNSNAALKRYAEEGKLAVYDKKTLKEMEGYIELAEEKYGCEEGENQHDDRVDALRWACYFAVSDYWRDLEEFIRKERGIDITGEYQDLGFGEEKFKPIIFSPAENTDSVYRDNDGLVWG